MQYRQLGRSGVRVSALALGTDNILNPTPEDESIRLIHAAIDGGINLIDTSNSYRAGEAERVIGKALRLRGKRDDVLVATKFHYPTGPGPNDRGNSRAHLIQACEELAAPAASRPHRPVPVAPPRHGRAAGRDARRARRPRAVGQGAVRRHVDVPGLARHGVDHDVGAEGPRARRLRAVAVQPARPADRERAAADVPPPRRRRPLLVAARDGHAGRPLRVVSRPRGRLPRHAARRHLRRTGHRGRHRRGQRLRGAGPRARLRAGAAGGAVDEGPAGRDGADRRAEVGRAADRAAAGRRHGSARRHPRGLRRAGHARQLRRSFFNSATWIQWKQ